jgi:hypothetical protein
MAVSGKRSGFADPTIKGMEPLSIMQTDLVNDPLVIT